MYLLLIEQPAFTTHPDDPQTRREGENITFSSDANGIPEPTFTWTKNGSAVTVNDRIILLAANKQLNITNVNRTDWKIQMCGYQQFWHSLLRCCYVNSTL